MKRFFTFACLSVILVLAAGAAFSNVRILDDSSLTRSGDWVYAANDDENIAALNFYLGKETELKIPTTIDGYEVNHVNIFMFERANKATVKSIIVAEDNPYFASKDGILYDKQMTKVILCPPAFSGHCTIPNTVTEIRNNAFYKCSDLTSVIIPDSVTTIGVEAFMWCYSLVSVIIPDSVTSIGRSAFACCPSLSTVIIPDSVAKIEDYTFWGCGRSLSTVILPSTIESIGKGAFAYCYNLKTVIIPNHQTVIADDAFFECSKLSQLPQFKGEMSAKPKEDGSQPQEEVQVQESEPIYLPRIILDDEGRLVREF